MQNSIHRPILKGLGGFCLNIAHMYDHLDALCYSTRFRQYDVLNILCPHQIHMLKSSYPRLMALEDGAFGGMLGHGGGTLMNGICVLIKEIPESSFAPLHCVRTQQEGAGYESGSGPHRDVTLQTLLAP